MLEGSLKHRCQSWGSRFWDGDLHEILLYNMRDILHWLPWCDPGPGTYFCSSPKLTQPFLLLSTPPIAHCCQTSNGFMFLDVELFLQVCCIPRSSSSPVIFFLVFSFLIYNPFFLLLFLLEVSPLSLHVPSSSVVWFLLSLTGIFLLLPVLSPHLICALSSRSSPSYAIPSFQRLPIL